MIKHQFIICTPIGHTCCGLWTLSCGFVPHNYETLKWLSSLLTLMHKSSWWWQCSDRYIISPPPPPPYHTPFSPSLINLMVSVDVKHHVYYAHLEFRSCVKVEVAVLGFRPNEPSDFRGREAILNYVLVMMMNWCLMSSDVMRHIRDKLWPMPKHGAINLYVHGNQKAR